MDVESVLTPTVFNSGFTQTVGGGILVLINIPKNSQSQVLQYQLRSLLSWFCVFLFFNSICLNLSQVRVIFVLKIVEECCNMEKEYFKEQKLETIYFIYLCINVFINNVFFL